MSSIPVRDSRSRKGGRVELALTNQALVYEIFKDGEKLTVTDAHSKLALSLASKNQHPLNDRTIRRAIEALVNMGQLKEFGRTATNAILYGRVDVGIEAESKEPLVNLGGNLTPVKDFVQALADPEGNPFSLNPDANLLSSEREQLLKSLLLYVVISSGQTGQEAQLKKVLDNLGVLLNEAEHLVKVLKSFRDSPVWFAHYRDPIALSVRNLQKENPELFKLAIDCIKGG